MIKRVSILITALFLLSCSNDFLPEGSIDIVGPARAGLVVSARLGDIDSIGQSTTYNILSYSWFVNNVLVQKTPKNELRLSESFVDLPLRVIVHVEDDSGLVGSIESDSVTVLDELILSAFYPKYRGIYRKDSMDGGLTWTSEVVVLEDTRGSYSIDVITDFKNSLWLSNTNSSSGTRTIQLLKSEDSGANWHEVSIPEHSITNRYYYDYSDLKTSIDKSGEWAGAWTARYDWEDGTRTNAMYTNSSGNWAEVAHLSNARSQKTKFGTFVVAYGRDEVSSKLTSIRFINVLDDIDSYSGQQLFVYNNEWVRDLDFQMTESGLGVVSWVFQGKTYLTYTKNHGLDWVEPIIISYEEDENMSTVLDLIIKDSQIVIAWVESDWNEDKHNHYVRYSKNSGENWSESKKVFSTEFVTSYQILLDQQGAYQINLFETGRKLKIFKSKNIETWGQLSETEEFVSMPVMLYH